MSKEYQLMDEPVRVGGVYKNGENRYWVASWDDTCEMPTVHLCRQDGFEFDAVMPTLCRTRRGVELIWTCSKNGHFVRKGA